MIDFKDAAQTALATQTAVRKFFETGRGVNVNTMMKQGDPALELNFHALRNPDRISIYKIKEVMNNLWKNMASMNPDPLLSDNNIYLRHKNNRDEIIVITNEDAYLFLRDAYTARCEDAEYLKNKQRKAEIEFKLSELKTPKELREELEAELKTL